jgi:hypothetical protein
VNPPRRLRDDRSASAEGRALLQGARASKPMPPAVRARSSARVDRMLVVPAAAAALFWIKGVAAAVVCAAGVVAAVRVAPAILVRIEGPAHTAHDSRSAPKAAPEASGARSVAAVAPTIAPGIATRVAPHFARPDAPSAPPPMGAAPVTPPTAPSPGVPPSSDAARGRAAMPTPAAAPTDTLAREAAMLESARALLDRDPAAALGVLDRHAAMFPEASLAIERELLAVEALQRVGRTQEARSRGARLAGLAAGSIYEARVNALLQHLAE